MKTLIVYFSLGGNTKWIAEKLHRKLPNTTLHTIEMKSKSLKSKWLQMIAYGFKTTFYRSMPIKDSTINMGEFDAVIIGAPVWVGNVPPPMLEFLKQYSIKEKKVAAFCSMGGEPSKYFEDFKKAAGIEEFAATLSIVEPLQNLKEATFEKVDTFVKEVSAAFEIKEELV